MQHGLAVDKAEDPERPLSEVGIHQTKKIANILLKSKIPISAIFHSGKLRAAQTADIVARTKNLDAATMIEGLSPNDEVTLLSQNLDTCHALYVGHLPHLEKLASYLLSGKVDVSVVKFQNSGVLCLEKEVDQYLIRWLLIQELTVYK
ncbi:MAG: phosphohistidine phosphatase SixA [Sulfurovum sp.]|nr:phosphohistidine phosphatase SixA [Sulfurovum sp.]NNJ44515.1 phosphohistidine phosphatase SixA [Sulfurovum sp.]